MVEGENINVKVIVVLGVISALLLGVVFLGVQAWFYNAFDAEMRAKMADGMNWERANLRLDQQERINRYSWVDQKAQTVTIPIDLAIELTAQRLSERGAR